MISNASVINTGNGIVDQIGTMGIVGHMTPDNWFSWILRENGKPNLLAMREYGYPVLDCKIYEDMTEEQRIEHKENKKDYGLEGYEYKQKKTAEQETQIKANEQTLSVISQDIVKAKKDLNITNAKIAEDKTAIEKQKEESKELGVRILSKKQVLELPDPPKTLDGKHYKVPVTEYNNVKATAGQVNEIKKDYEKRKAAVDKREKLLSIDPLSLL